MGSAPIAPGPDIAESDGVTDIDSSVRLALAEEQGPLTLWAETVGDGPAVHREYLLDYAGKQAEGDILLDTPALPFQRVRSFGAPDPGAWENMLVQGDNLPILRRLMDMKSEGLLHSADGTAGVRLVYIDPPFGSEDDYENKSGVISYADRVTGARFIESLRKRLILIREVMADDGSIFIHLDGRKSHYIKVVMDEVFGEHNFRNEIIWHYFNKLQGNVHRFASDHDTIFWYTKSETFFFTPLMEERPGGPVLMLKRRWDPATKKLVNAKDEAGHVEYIERTHKTADDVWRMPMLQPASREMIGYPTQKPEALVDRIIRSASRPGDLVLDCFAGSGSTLMVAEKLARRWIGVDLGLNAIYTIEKRLLDLAASPSLTETRTKRTQPKPCCGTKGCQHCATFCCPPTTSEVPTTYRKPARPFALHSSGHYDIHRLKALPFAEYRTFVLRLFGATDQPADINAVHVDGRHRGDPVVVYDFTADDAVATLDYLDEMAAFLEGRVGDRVLFIAPAASLGFLDDQVATRGITFEIRRVPYSVVREIQRRAHQPVSEAAINKIVETVGFDFKVPPSATFTVDAGARTLTLTAFRTEAIVKGLTETDRGLGSLAMILVDYDHDGAVFDLDAVAFADDLRGRDYRMALDRAQPGRPVAISFCDIYGNERIEVLRDQAWGGA